MSFASAALTSSAKQDWRTPPYVLEVVRKLGPIALDPFTSADNPTGARRFLTAADNGFAHDWLELADGGLIFVNPEFGRALERTVRFVAWQAERGAQIVLLTPARTDTRFAQVLFEKHDALCFWKGRIDFEAHASTAQSEQLAFFDEPTSYSEPSDSSGTFPVLFTYFGPRVWDFKKAFAPHGTVFMRGRGHTGPWACRGGQGA